MDSEKCFICLLPSGDFSVLSEKEIESKEKITLVSELFCSRKDALHELSRRLTEVSSQTPKSILPRYAIERSSGGWNVVMAANGYIVENGFSTEAEAAQVMDLFERGERFLDTKVDVWVIDDAFVLEPDVEGLQLGEISYLDMAQFNVVARYTEAEFEEMQEERRAEHDSYPDE